MNNAISFIQGHFVRKHNHTYNIIHYVHHYERELKGKYKFKKIYMSLREEDKLQSKRNVNYEALAINKLLNTCNHGKRLRIIKKIN